MKSVAGMAAPSISAANDLPSALWMLTANDTGAPGGTVALAAGWVISTVYAQPAKLMPIASTHASPLKVFMPPPRRRLTVSSRMPRSCTDDLAAVKAETIRSFS